MGAVVDVLGGDLLATPLHWAIREGHLPMVVLLMKYRYVLIAVAYRWLLNKTVLLLLC